MPCVFIVFSSTQSAYYCLDPKTHKIYTSRHVQFVEHEFPYSDLASSPNFVEKLIEEWCPLSIPICTQTNVMPLFSKKINKLSCLLVIHQIHIF